MRWRCDHCESSTPDASSGFRDPVCATCGGVMRAAEAESVAWTCPRCGASLDATASRCGVCDARDRHEVRKGRCPACGVELFTRTFGDADVHACSVCNGMMVATDVLRGWTEEGARRAPADAPLVVFKHDWSVHYRRCPQCTSTMNRLNFAPGTGVIVDVCPTHGYWLDAGELERIVEYVRKHGAEGTALRRQEVRQRTEAFRARVSSELAHLDPMDVMTPTTERLGRLLLALLGWD